MDVHEAIRKALGPDGLGWPEHLNDCEDAPSFACVDPFQKAPDEVPEVGQIQYAQASDIHDSEAALRAAGLFAYAIYGPCEANGDPAEDVTILGGALHAEPWSEVVGP